MVEHIKVVGWLRDNVGSVTRGLGEDVGCGLSHHVSRMTAWLSEDVSVRLRHHVSLRLGKDMSSMGGWLRDNMSRVARMGVSRSATRAADLGICPCAFDKGTTQIGRTV